MEGAVSGPVGAGFVSVVDMNHLCTVFSTWSHAFPLVLMSSVRCGAAQSLK